LVLKWFAYWYFK
jgi:hypothetical protein